MLGTSKFLLQGSSRVPVMKESKIICYFSPSPQVLTIRWDMHVHELLYSAQKENEFWDREKKKHHHVDEYQYQACSIETHYENINSFLSSFFTQESNQVGKTSPSALKSKAGHSGGKGESWAQVMYFSTPLVREEPWPKAQSSSALISGGWCCSQGFGFYDKRTSGTRATK